MQSPGGISTLTRRFGLVALVLVGGIATPSLAEGAQGVAQVRDVGVSWVAGPLRLTPGGSAQARLWLPAEQRSFKVTFLGDGGEVLGGVEVEMPTPAGALFEVVYEARYDGRALSITDGTSNTIIVHEGSQGIVAILIGLRKASGPPGRLAMTRGPMATLQVLDGQGQTVVILPFIEQDN